MIYYILGLALLAVIAYTVYAVMARHAERLITAEESEDAHDYPCNCEKCLDEQRSWYDYIRSEA